ncbi:MAG TPA: Uma2 family endonuclease [Planctomycetota bacterium]|nr:Uma2 family endonuclease [Planctomycetota bacterium]
MAQPMRSNPTFTWQDYQQLPDDGLRYEVLDGELVVSPSPLTNHQLISCNLLRRLCEQIADPGLGKVLSAPYDVRLSDVDVVQPDLVVVLRDSLFRLGPGHLDGPPDLVVEILSPGTARRDLGIKKERYRAFGVSEYWIVDPAAYVVEQFVLERGEYRSTGEHTASVDLHILPGARVDLTRVW